MSTNQSSVVARARSATSLTHRSNNAHQAPLVPLLKVQVASEGAHQARIPWVVLCHSRSCAIAEIATILLIFITTIVTASNAAAFHAVVMMMVIVEAAAVRRTHACAYASCACHAHQVGCKSQRAYARRCSGEAPPPAMVALRPAAAAAAACNAA